MAAVDIFMKSMGFDPEAIKKTFDDMGKTIHAFRVQLDRIETRQERIENLCAALLQHKENDYAPSADTLRFETRRETDRTAEGSGENET